MIDIDLLKTRGYIEASTYRTKVMKNLENEYLTPTQISKKSQIRVNHISKTLWELKQKKLIECINEEAHKGRLYHLTEKGEKVRKILK